ncbi:MAG: hypothetical protein AAF561_15270, partial [Planctomycetota bacterium]
MMLHHKTVAALVLATSAVALPTSAAPEVVASGTITLGGTPISGSQGPSLQANQQPLVVAGTGGSGQLQVLDGGFAQVNFVDLGAEGVAVIGVDGIGSQLISQDVVSRRANIAITNGGTWLASDFRHDVDRSTTILVDGAGSTLSVFNSLELAIGQSGGVGILNVVNGGTVSAGDFEIGASGGGPLGVVRVAGAGSRLDAEFNTVVETSSSLTIADNGVLSADQLEVFGTVMLDGGIITGTASNSTPEIRVGMFPTPGRLTGSGTVQGRLFLQNASIVQVGPAQSLDFDAPFDQHFIGGTVVVDGGSISFDEATGDVTPSGSIVSSGGVLSADQWLFGGKLQALGGGLTELFGNAVLSSAGNNPASIQVAESSQLRVYDTLSNNDVVDVRPGSTATFLDAVFGGGSYVGGGAFIFLGTLAPGNSPAEVSFQGDVTLGTSSTLDIELAGLTNGSFDRLDVSG